MSSIQESYVNKDGNPTGAAGTYWGKGHLLFDMYPLDISKLQHHSESQQNYCNI